MNLIIIKFLLFKQKKLRLEQLLNDSETFMVDYFTSLHYVK